MSTLRGTPPHHLFDVDRLWNDPPKFEFWFYASVACVAFSVSDGGSWSPFWELWEIILGSKIVHFGSLGGPWDLGKTDPEKERKKEENPSYPYLYLRHNFGSVFR